MIHLDTNLLVAATDPAYSSYKTLQEYLRAGREFATSAIAWSEFLTGPVAPHQIQLASIMIADRVVPFTSAEAKAAADLFNLIGRRRSQRVDCFIAACALVRKADFATENQRDFQPFVAAGLRLL